MHLIHYYLLNQLVNKEFPGAYRQITAHLEGVEFEVEDVQQAFNAVKAKVENLDYVKSSQAMHPLTAEIEELTEERHQYLLLLRGRVKYAKKSPIAEEREAAKTLHVWLGREQKSFTHRNMDHQNDAVHRMLHDLIFNGEMSAALETLGIASTMDFLRTITGQILSHTIKRRDDRTAASKKSGKLRRDAYLAMKALVMAMEVAMVLKKGDDDNHIACLTKINIVVTDFHAKHLSRISRQRNAAEEAKAETIKNAQPENGVQSGGNVVPMGGKLATAGRSNAFSVQTQNDIDLQNGAATTNVAMKGTPAMNESVTSGEALDGNNEKASNSIASVNGTSKIGDEALDNMPNSD